MNQSKYHSLAWHPILAVGLSMVSFIMIKTGRDAVFFQDWGLRQLPLAYIWVAVAAVPAALIHLNALGRWGARKTRTGLFFVTAALFLLFLPFTAPHHKVLMTIMFILVPTVFAAVFAGVWLMAADLLEGASGGVLRIVYSRIGAASMVGGIVGGLLSKGISVYLEPRFLIGTGAGVLIIVGFLIAKAHRDNPVENYSKFETAPPKPNKTNDAFTSKQSVLIKQKYVRLLMGISVMATIAALYIDFQFYAVATISGNNNAQFFANFYIILNTVSLAIQLFISPRLQAKLGVGGALLLLPLALLGGSGVFLFWTTVQARTILRIMEGGLKSSIHRSMWEQVYLLIDRKFRDVAKTVVDGTVQRVAEGTGAVALLVWFMGSDRPVEELNFNWITWAIMGTVLLWLLLTKRLGKFGCNDIDPVEAFIRLPDG